MIPIEKVASVIRSKNAKAFGLTLDIMFKSHDDFVYARDSGAITPERIAELYHLALSDVRYFAFLEPVNSLKATITRPMPCGAVGDPDVYGCQQHAPLYELQLPDPAGAEFGSDSVQ